MTAPIGGVAADLFPGPADLLTLEPDDAVDLAALRCTVQHAFDRSPLSRKKWSAAGRTVWSGNWVVDGQIHPVCTYRVDSDIHGHLAPPVGTEAISAHIAAFAPAVALKLLDQLDAAHRSEFGALKESELAQESLFDALAHIKVLQDALRKATCPYDSTDSSRALIRVKMFGLER